VEKAIMNKYSIAIDIETCPNGELVAQAVGERKPFIDKPLDLSQWKMEKTRVRKQKEWEESLQNRIKAHEEAENEKYDKAMKAAGLRADQCTVLCISYCGNEGNWCQWADEVGGEQSLLESLWDKCEIAQRRGGMVFSASGTNFDVRIPWRRSIQLGIKFPHGLQIFAPNRGYRPQIHRSFVDLIEVYGAGEYQFKIRVNDLCRAFGVEPKREEEGVSGANFWQSAIDDRDKAERYALRDSQLVWEIAQKMDKCGVWIESPPPASRVQREMDQEDRMLIGEVF
jgi:hypothetical protein